MDRVIFHCDLNCFYASVELLSHPELRTDRVNPSSRFTIRDLTNAAMALTEELWTPPAPIRTKQKTVWAS